MGRSEYHTLDTISMADFERLYFGDISVVSKNGTGSEDELKAAATEIIQKYIQIISGESAAAELSKRNTILKLEMRIVVLQAAKSLADARMYEDACKVMAALGYRLKPESKEAISRKIDGVLASDTYRLETAKKQAEKENTNEIDHDYFVKERVQVMRWAKMRISPDDITAIEYAYLIKAMCDEYKQQEKELNKIKAKK